MPQFPINCYDYDGDDYTVTHADVGPINVDAGIHTFSIDFDLYF